MILHHARQKHFAVGFILYHPEDKLFKRIEQIIDLGFAVYVFDNSPFDTATQEISRFGTDVRYITAGKNVGLGYSLATVCATAYADGWHRILFLDQDTGISCRTLDYISNYASSLTDDILDLYAVLVFNGCISSDQRINDVTLAISSGSLFNLRALTTIGWHNERYFVDCVDYELCLRAKRYGFRIGIVKNTPDFDHVSEQPDQEVSLFGKKMLIRRYPVGRIKDALGAYIKLIVGGMFKNHLSDTCILLKSVGLYIFGQILARVVLFENRNGFSIAKDDNE